MRYFGRWSSSLSLVAVAASLGGCPSNPPGPIVPADVPLADLPSYLAPEICAVYGECGGPVVAIVYGTGADCEAQLEARFADDELGTIEDAIAAGSIAYHGELVGDCIAALEAAGCNLGNPFETCEAIFEGLVPDGGACELNEECGASSYCAISGACPGACQARVASGSTCTDSAGCLPGLSCTGGTCRTPAGEGAACGGTTGVSCSNIGLSCIGSSGTTPGVCTDLDTLFTGVAGEVCDAESQDFCNPDLSCAVDMVGATGPTFRCVARVAAGAACTAAVPDMCPADQYCSGLSVGGGGAPDLDGVCAALPTAGQPCTMPIGLPFPRCASGLVCVGSGSGTGTCEVLGRIGASCTSDQTCASSNCDGGSCAAGTPSGCATAP
jgi:hypothetical protein